ncbi:hypothetical protein [Haliscomenobacter sp.]|uniref:hypothetical protein n=1 Tax=Haliscomenobacter sp. TaxID=2717303 RepID=UPI0035946832
MNQLVSSFLILFTIAAILQPLILFYSFRGDLMAALFPAVGLLGTLFLIGFNYWQIKNLPKVFFPWSIIIFLIGLGTFSIPERWIYTADGLLLLKQREEIVAEIKRSQNRNSIYSQKGWLPISVNNQIQIQVEAGVYREITFPTIGNSFFGYFQKGVLYSELAEQDIPFDRQEEAGGVITESKLTLRKIKPRWYFYTYQRSTIQD